MHLSQYVVEIAQDDNVIIFSTISKAVVQFSNYEYKMIKGGCIPDSLTEYEAYLRSRSIITDFDNETNKVLFTLTSNRLSPNTLSTYIAFSTECNFTCVYCYEKGQVDLDARMSASTIDALLIWYKRILLNSTYNECCIHLYGGEPLLEIESIRSFLFKLKAFLSECNIALKVKILTNGYLLDEKTLDMLIDNGLQEAQITLDGTRDIHDQRRMLKDGTGTFDKIIANLINARDKAIDFVLRISFDFSNVKNIIHLLNYLKTQPLSQNLTIYFAPIHKTCYLQYQDHYVTGCSELISYYKLLYQHAHNLQFKIPYYFSNGPCMFVAADACLIAPDGNLYKCVEMIGIKELCIGNIINPDYNQLYYNILCNAPISKCILSGCIYSPICSGGCAMHSYLEKSDFSQKDCNKLVIKEMTEFLIKLNYVGDYE